MSYPVTDASVQDGSPEELYLFVTGTLRHAYTNSRSVIVYGGDSYLPAQITRGKIVHTADIGRRELIVRCPVSLAVAAMYLPGAPSKLTEVRIYRRHILDGAAEYAAVWRGEVRSMRPRGMEAEIVCGQGRRRTGLRGNYAIPCRHALYGEGCGADKSLFVYAGTSASVIGSTVVVPGASLKPDGWYNGGLLVWGEQSRLVVKHSGDILQLLVHVPGLAGGQPVSIYPGCDHSHAVCRDKFARDYYHGGFPWFTADNPFTGDGVA